MMTKVVLSNEAGRALLSFWTRSLSPVKVITTVEAGRNRYRAIQDGVIVGEVVDV